MAADESSRERQTDAGESWQPSRQPDVSGLSMAARGSLALGSAVRYGRARALAFSPHGQTRDAALAVRHHLRGGVARL
jgi:hypothetical protein